MTPIKLKIIEIKADALIEAIDQWATDNAIELPENYEYSLKKRIRLVLSEME